MLHSTLFITLVLANRCFFLCLNLDVLSSDISVLNLVGRIKSYMVNFHWQSRPLKLWS